MEHDDSDDAATIGDFTYLRAMATGLLMAVKELIDESPADCRARVLQRLQLRYTDLEATMLNEARADAEDALLGLRSVSRELLAAHGGPPPSDPPV